MTLSSLIQGETFTQKAIQMLFGAFYTGKFLKSKDNINNFSEEISRINFNSTVLTLY